MEAPPLPNTPDDPPDNIAGTWACTFSREGSDPLQESWTIGQSGQEVRGSYTFGETSWSFLGTYADGVLSGSDADG